MHRSWSAIKITMYSRDVSTHVFSLLLYVSSHPRSVFFEKMLWSHMIYKDVGALSSCPLHRAHSSARAVPDTASHNGTPREWHTNSNLSLETLTFCSQILKSVVFCYCLYSPVISTRIIKSPKSTFPSSTVQLPQEGELLSTCCFACWQTLIYLFNFLKTPELLALLQTQEAKQCPGLTDRCSSRLELKKTKLHHNLPYKRVPPIHRGALFSKLTSTLPFQTDGCEGQRAAGHPWVLRLPTTSVLRCQVRV